MISLFLIGICLIGGTLAWAVLRIAYISSFPAPSVQCSTSFIGEAVFLGLGALVALIGGIGWLVGA